MRIYDQWIDFVNLRSEEYTENSRIPTMVLLLIHCLCSFNVFICCKCITKPILNIETILIIWCCNVKDLSAYTAYLKVFISLLYYRNLAPQKRMLIVEI